MKADMREGGKKTQNKTFWRRGQEGEETDVSGITEGSAEALTVTSDWYFYSPEGDLIPVETYDDVLYLRDNYNKQI